MKKLHKFYNDFEKILETKTFKTGADIIEEFPDLQ
jgi:hypothetical protein